MKKIVLFVAAVAILIVACNKNEVENILPTKQKISANDKDLPIAKINDKGEIELLFLQKDVQEIFNKEFPNLELLYIEIYDEKPLYEKSEVALAFQIQDNEKKVRETSIQFSIYKEKNVYYAPATNLSYSGGLSVTLTCTSYCEGERGCYPEQSGGKWRCTPSTCNSCIKTESSMSIYNLTQFVRLAALNYQMMIM